MNLLYSFPRSGARRLAVRRSSQAAISLIEMLVVMSIMVLLAGSAANLFSGFQTNDHKKALMDIGNAFELARQTAISHNTYTYVAFTTPHALQSPSDPLCVATFESLSNQDILQDVSAQADASKWQFLTRPIWLRNIEVDQVDDSNPPPAGLVPVGQAISATMKTLASGGFYAANRQIGDMTTSANLTFNRVVTFAPDGTVIVENSRGLPAALIGFLVTPCRGPQPSAKEKMRTAAVTIGGFLGSIRFYQYQ